MYKRILLKISGEALNGENNLGIEKNKVQKILQEIKAVRDQGAQIALVLGAGNFWRYRDMTGLGIERTKSDQLGMLATIFNCVVFQSLLKEEGIAAEVYATVAISGLTKIFQKNEALQALQEGKIALLAGGTGNPYFTTDSAAVLRALELECEVIIKATKVDGVFDSDPVKNPQAHKFEKLTYQEVIEQNLQVMDLAAIALCKENQLPLIVYNLFSEGSLLKLAQGEQVGTRVGD